MTEPQGSTGIAFNQATASENKIHSDEVARQYGFGGGLVPGVTVYAYLVQPAVVAWGEAWLAGGGASVLLKRPLYDGGAFRTEAKADGPETYAGALFDADGVLCAEGRVVRAAEGPAPARRGDPPAPAGGDRPDATRDALERLRDAGPGALELRWGGSGELARYTRELESMPDLVRPDRGGFAHPAFSLGLANTALSANVRLGPWIHVQSDVRHFAAIPVGSELVVESRVRDLFERGGHEFVDLDVAVFLAPDTPALTAEHRAIYRLRPPEDS